MYQHHFGLDRPLFEDRLAQETEVFLSPRHQAFATNLGIALGASDAVATVTGAAGTGKTTLSAHALRCTTTRLALACLGTAPLSLHELLEHLLNEFGFDPSQQSRAERLRDWRRFLNEMGMTNTRVCILVDKAETWSEEVLAAAESLTGADAGGCPGASLLLTGGAALRDRLAAPALETLRQRVRFSHRLDALTAQEFEQYLAFKLEACGSDPDRVFAPGAASLLHDYTRGVLRVAKNVCESVLTVAATRGDARIAPELVTQVAVGLYAMPPVGPMPASGSGESADRLEIDEHAELLPADPSAADTSTAIDVPVAAGETDAAGLSPAAGESDVAVAHGEADELAEAADRCPVEDYDARDVPTLTDTVEIPDDDLLRDALAGHALAHGETEDTDWSGRDDDGAPATDAVDHRTTSQSAVACAAEGEAELASDDDVDPQLDALQALANARALEDISNSMAETLFGDAELEQLGATLAVASAYTTAQRSAHRATHDRARNDGSPANARDVASHGRGGATGGHGDRDGGHFPTPTVQYAS